MSQALVKNSVVLNTTSQTVYTVPVNKATVAKMFMSNLTSDATAVSVTVKVNSTYIVKSIDVFPGQTMMIDIPVHLKYGDIVTALASKNNACSIYISAIEYSNITNITNAMVSVTSNYTPVITASSNCVARLILSNTTTYPDVTMDVYYYVIVRNIGDNVIASQIPLIQGTSELFDVGINLAVGDTLMVKTNAVVNSVNSQISAVDAFASISIL